MKKLSLLSFLIVSCLLVSIAKALPRFEFDVTKKMLPNGVVVLVSENHNSPIVSYQSWVKVGSQHELPGKTGLAHLFEHLMFKGTARYPDKVLEKIFEQNGVSHNAYTTHDYTVYFEDLPKEKLELIVDIESDRFKALSFKEDVFESEKKVVQEERLMRSEQSLEGLMSEKLWALMFQKHPYKNPVIGWPQDIESLTYNDAIDFFKKHYVPQNLVISVSGDVNTTDVFKLIEKYYGDLKIGTLESYKPFSEKEIKEEKKIEMMREVRAERVLLGYKIGKAGDKDSFALDLAALILAHGKTSRLYKKLVLEERIVSGVVAEARTPMDNGIFEIEAHLKPGVSVSQVVPIIDKELLQLQKNQVSKTELQKAKLWTYKETLTALRTAHGRAQNLALNEVLTGNFKNLFDDIDQYNAVTAADIQNVFTKYINPHSRVRIDLKAK